MQSVLVSVLNMGSIQAGLESSLIKWMNEKSDKYGFEYYPSREVPTDSNRNLITKRFLESDHDYLAMFDEDTFPHRNPFGLLDFDKPVIGGVYPGWGINGFRFHVYRREGDEYVQYPVEERAGLKKVDAIGTGCIFIKRGVLEKMKTPFSYIYEDGVLVRSDDIAFCDRCGEAGIDIWAHWDYQCSHFKTVDLMLLADMIVRAAKTGKPNLKIE